MSILYPSEREDLQTTWRCVQQEGVDIRLEIGFNVPRHGMPGLVMNEVVKEASEERTGRDGIRYLRLADGKGWVPTTDPHGQMLFIRVNTKRIQLKVEQPWQWSEAGLLSRMRSSNLRPWLAVRCTK